MPDSLNNQIFALLSSATNVNSNVYEEKREHHNLTNLKVIASVKISAAKVPNRPKSSGANRIQPVGINKELFNATAPLKFMKANLDDSTMVRESLIGHQSGINRPHGSIPAKHNLLAASMRLNPSTQVPQQDEPSRQQKHSAQSTAYSTKLNVIASKQTPNPRKALNQSYNGAMPSTSQQNSQSVKTKKKKLNLTHDVTTRQSSSQPQGTTSSLKNST